MVKLNGVLKYRFFNTSPNRKVIIGTDGWLFYGHDLLRNDKEYIFSDFSHRNLIATGKLAIYENTNTKIGPTILFFRDSFGDCLTKFLSLHFKKIIFVRGRYRENMINKYQPDIVIEGHVERHLVI